MPKTTRPPKLPEAAVQRAILRALEARERLGQLIVDRRNTGAAQAPGGRFTRYGVKGDSDIYGAIRGGRMFAIEVKREGWTPPKSLKPGASKSAVKQYQHWQRQLARLQRVNEVGGLGFWTDSAVYADAMIELAIKDPAVFISDVENQMNSYGREES